MQYFLGAVLISTGWGLFSTVSPAVVALPVTTAPVGVVAVAAAVGAAHVLAASSPAAA